MTRLWRAWLVLLDCDVEGERKYQDALMAAEIHAQEHREAREEIAALRRQVEALHWQSRLLVVGCDPVQPPWAATC